MSSDSSNAVKNSLFSILQIAAAALGYLLIYWIIIKRLGHEELGVWSIITSLPVAISVFGSGVSGCVLRYIPIYAAKEDEKAFNGIIFSGLIFNFVLGGFFALTGYFFSTPLLEFLFSKKSLPDYYYSVFYIALGVFYVNFISSVLVFALDGLQLIHVRNKIMILGSALLCVSGSLLISGFGLKGVLYGQLLQGSIVALLAGFTLANSKLFNLKFLRLQKLYLRLFLTYGKGFQAISLCALLFEPLTKYFLNKYFNLSVVGSYDIINRIVVQVRTLVVSAVQVITPLVSKGNALGTLDISNVYQKTIRGASLLSYCLYSVVFTLCMFVVVLNNSVQTKTYLFILVFMVLAYHSNIIASVAYSMLLGLGKLKYLVVSHLLSVGVNAILFCALGNVLVERFMVLPVAVSIIVSSLYVLHYFNKEFNITKIEKQFSDEILKFLSFASILVVVILVVTNVGHYYLLAFLVVQCCLTLYFVYRNDFFKGMIRKALTLGR